MPDRSTWLWTIAAIAVWSLVAVEAHSAEMRIQHTSKVSKKVTERVIEVAYSTCVDGASLLRKTAVGKVRVWCNGRRV